MTFDSFGSSYCLLWLLCVFCPLVVLCRMMFDKWKFIPQLVYFHFAITLSSILAWYKYSQCCGIFVRLHCLAFFILSVLVTTRLKYMLTWKLLKGPFTEFVFEDFLNCHRQSWKSLNYLSFLFKWNTPLLFLELNGLNLSMFVSLFKLLFLV